MPYTYEDKVLIKHYSLDKGYGAKRILKEFPQKNWTKGGLDKLLRKLKETGNLERQEGSGRPKTVRIEENILEVEDRILSQENNPGSHRTPRQIAKELSLSRSSIRRIVKRDLNLNVFKRIHGQKLTAIHEQKRVAACKRMLRIITPDKLNRTFFSDEKKFTVEPPHNSQNDRVYSDKNLKSDITEKRLYATRNHFSKSVMVWVGISKLGKTSIFFVDPEVKIDAAYYSHTLLEKMIPEMKNLANNGHFLFQQDGARSHTANITVQFLQNKVPELLYPTDWPPNSPDLNPIDYGIWENLSERVYQHKIRDTQHLKNLIIEKWNQLPQEQVNRAIDQFRERLRKVINVSGKHIEHYF